MEEFFNEKQKEALNFFHENIDKLANDPLYRLKYIIIYGNNISGIFDTFDNALKDALFKYPQHDFIIQQVIPDNEVVNFLYPAVH